MSDLRQAALEAEAALAAFLAKARAAGVLWERDEKALNGALSVVREHTKGRR